MTGDILQRVIGKNNMIDMTGVLAMTGAIQEMTKGGIVNQKDIPEMIIRTENMRGGVLVIIKNSTLGGALQAEINMRTGIGLVVNKERNHPEI